MRKLRKLTIDVAQFLTDYHDAISSGMSVREFCEVSGLSIATLHGRIETLAKRGVVLPQLNGMRRKTRMGRRLLGIRPPADAKPVVVDAIAVEPAPMPMPPLAFTFCVGSDF
jgi:hypothetical protein